MQSIQVIFFGSENIDVGTTRLSPNMVKPIQKDQLNANVMEKHGNLIAWADMDDQVQYMGALLTSVHVAFMTRELGWHPMPVAPGRPQKVSKPKPPPKPAPEPKKAPEPPPAAPEPPPEPVKAPEPTVTTTTAATGVTTMETVDTDTVVLEKDDMEESILADVFKDEDEPTIEPIEEKPKKKAPKKKAAKKGGKKKGGKKKKGN